MSDELDIQDKPEKKAKRKVLRKKLYVCEGIDNKDPSAASAFGVVAGPFDETPDAVRHIRDELPAGEYVLMYEGKTVRKFIEQVTRIEE